MHFEILVEDLEATVQRVLRLGGAQAPHQPHDRDQARIRVMLDPAGHRFCVSSLPASRRPSSTILVHAPVRCAVTADDAERLRTSLGRTGDLSTTGTSVSVAPMAMAPLLSASPTEISAAFLTMFETVDQGLESGQDGILSELLLCSSGQARGDRHERVGDQACARELRR